MSLGISLLIVVTFSAGLPGRASALTSGSTEADDWEAARAELAGIIEGTLTCPDLDGDGDVDITDIMLVAARWHTTEGDEDYAPLYDLNDDGKIDIVDIMLVVVHWGESCEG